MRPNKHFLRAHFLTAPVSIKFDQLLKRLRALFKSSSDFPWSPLEWAFIPASWSFWACSIFDLTFPAIIGQEPAKAEDENTIKVNTNKIFFIFNPFVEITK